MSKRASAAPGAAVVQRGAQAVQGQTQVLGGCLVGRFRPEERGQGAARMGAIRLQRQIGQQATRLVAAEALHRAAVQPRREGPKKIE
jgi:hypothetical protein